MTPPTSADQAAAPRPHAQQDRWRLALLSLGIVLGTVYAYCYRFAISPDGIGYLDVASAYLRHDWTTAIDSWWSPAYSWILALFLHVFSPTARTELPVLHLVNFLCFAWTAWSFHRFWRALSDSIEQPDAKLAGLPFLAPFAFDLFGYALLFLLFLPLIATPTPDIFASSFMFLIAERLLQCKTRGKVTWRDGATLGFLFAFGYLSKAILFYFSIVAIGIAVIDRSLKNRRALLVSAVVLIVVITPWVVALHHTFGRWTLGFAGPLNYAWFVDGTKTVTFPGPIGAPLPYFPGDRVFNQPAIYAVRTQSNITYVPWYDPGRFDKSDRPHFQWRGQIAALQKNLVWLRTWFFVNLGPMSVVVLALLLGSRAAISRIFARYLVVAVPTLTVFAMYSLVYIRTQRYIVALAVLLFGVGLASVRFDPANRLLVRAILASGLLVYTLTNLPGVLDAIAGLANHNLDALVEVAETLNHAGFPANSRVGTVGTGLYAYWARLARVNIAAEMWDEDTPLFWNADPSRRQAMLCVMGKAGASVVVGHPPPNADLSGWEPLGNSGYWMHRVPQECRQN
ncbi:MAG: hypothetical protein WCC87_04950 [Candidatus Korobacteraceae bacterium]